MSIETVVALITAIVALVGVLVSVFTLSQSARKDAFSQLESVVREFKEQLRLANEKINELEELLKASHIEKENLRHEIEERENKIDELTQRIDAQDALISSLKTMMDRRKN